MVRNYSTSTWKGSGNGQNKKNTLDKDSLYKEIKDGRHFFVYGENVQRPLPKNKNGKDRSEAQYVGVYMNSSEVNKANHIFEIEVNGKRTIGI